MRGVSARQRSWSIWVACVVCSVAVAAAWLIVSVSNDPSVGSLVRYLLVGFGAIAVVLAVVVGFQLGFRRIGLPTRRVWYHLPALAAGALLSAVAVSQLGSITGSTYSLVAILAAVGCVGALLLAFARTDSWGLGAFIVTYPFLAFLEWDPGSRLDLVYWLGPVAISPSIVFLWALVGATLLGRLVRRTGFVGGSSHKYVIGWSLLLLLSSLTSIRPLESLQEFYLNALTLPLFYWVAVNQINSKISLTRIIYAVIAFSVLRAAISYYLYARYSLAADSTFTDALVGISDPAIYRVVAHSDFLAWVTSFPLPLVLVMAMVNPSRRARFGLLLVLVFLVLVLFISNRRAPIVVSSAVLPLALLLWLRRDGKMTFAVPALVLLGATVVSYRVLAEPILFQRFSEWGSVQDFSYEQRWRLDAWQAGLQILKGYPLLGIGFGAWTDYYPFYSQYQPSGLWLQHVMNKPHNMFIHYAVAGGIGALVCWTALLTTALRNALGAWRRSQDVEVQLLASALFWSLLMVVLTGALGGVNSMVMKSWTITTGVDGGLLFWTILGGIASLERIKDFAAETPSA